MNLDQNTLYRFAEIEIQISLQHFRNIGVLDPYPLIIQLIGPLNDQELHIFYERSKGTESLSFRRPLKRDILYMLRYKGLGYNRITKLTGISPNTAIKWMQEIEHSTLKQSRRPLLPFWNEERLASWVQAAKSLNLYEEKFQINFQ